MQLNNREKRTIKFDEGIYYMEIDRQRKGESCLEATMSALS